MKAIRLHRKLPHLWNPTVQCRAHDSPPLGPTFSQLNQVHTLTFYSEIYLNIEEFYLMRYNAMQKSGWYLFHDGSSAWFILRPSR
jgi:hypothetical protein